MNGKRVEKGERGQNASSWLKDDERYFSRYVSVLCI
jgi:hypothetical protein